VNYQYIKASGHGVRHHLLEGRTLVDVVGASGLSFFDILTAICPFSPLE
jgi:hypothetical protein